jgi:ribonucleoside-diphosphate reductase alpha chain
MLSPDVELLLNQRYYMPGETWEDLVHRVVDYVCEDEEQDYIDEVYRQIHDRIWLPNSPCLVNAGRVSSGLMACFTVGPDEDTLEHHVEVLGDIAAVGKRGGGCGFSGNMIRPKGSRVAGSAHDKGTGIAYGPNWWAGQVSSYLAGITQGGFRSMALMYSLSSSHKDIDDFIELKQGATTEYNNFNQSLFVTDEWMESALYDSSVNKGRLWRVAENAWNNGEPGLLFDSRINGSTPYSTCGCDITTTNPCGEQPLPSYGSCNLASINLAHDFFYTESGKFDTNKLSYVVTHMVRFMDNVGTKNVFPNKKFQKWYEDHRPIGVGIMGYADALLRLKMVYGNEDALVFLKNVLETILGVSYAVSERLGIERGIPEHCEAVGRRNITTVTVAPTGSISFLAECSSSIEPIFAPYFIRTDEREQEYIFEHPLSDSKYFVQTYAQTRVDSGVSKTVNLPNDATVEDVYAIFKSAWKRGAKGITIYRDGSRGKQVLDTITYQEALMKDCKNGVCYI